ncbi:MAG: acetyl-CoA carboxylase carboxyl transferase subunit alpha [bacterium]|jgi:acetyl-CoA carboxylase carboxyl transferase subunit alpha
MYILEFEKPIIELRTKIEELKKLLKQEDIQLEEELEKLEMKANQLEQETYSKLDSWEKTQLSRHPKRPYTLDIIKHCFTDFQELHGDRGFRDDPSIVAGFAYLNKKPIMVIGHQKGRNTTENVHRNFGMTHPEGYRKALRLMKLADKFGVPILTLIDTPGAYPGIGAEERGQSEAIAVNLREMAALEVPVVSMIIGEGGSGGALALGVANRVLMLEHSIYSVISPEGCAGILWGDGTRAKEAAKSLRYTSEDLIEFEIIDEIVTEPIGGAHHKPIEAMNNIKKVVAKHFQQLQKLTKKALIEDRYERFRKIGAFSESV